MEATTKQTTQHGKFSITTDPEQFTVLIVRPSKSRRSSVKTVHHVRFTRGENPSTRLGNMQQFIDDFLNRQTSKEQQTQERKNRLREAKNTMESPFSIGDILYESWGYDQTNIDFHQVVGMTKATISTRQIAQERTLTASDQGTTMPVKDSFVDEELTKKRVNVYLSDGGPQAYVKGLHKWNGRPKFWSSYH